MMSLTEKVRKYIKEKGGLFEGGSFDTLFFVFLIAIIVIGLTMLYSATYVYAAQYSKNGDPATYFKNQLYGVIAGGVMMLVVSRLNYRALADIGAVGGTLLSWGLLAVALLMEDSNGTHRYVYLGSVQLQPSDIAKFALILTLALLLGKRHDLVVSKKPLQGDIASKVNSLFKAPVINESLRIILLCGFIIIVYAGLVIAGSHLSGTILILSIAVAMLYLGEVRGKWFVAGIILVAIAVPVILKTGLLKDYMQERITAWLDKDYDPLGARWQTNQALYAIASGGFLGKGLGNSTLKHLYVSEPQNDMIFSIVVEELGFVGAALIILLFALLIWRGFVIGINCPDRFGALVAMGVSFQLGIQVILNIAVATDSIPNTGISLPFFSYGRTSMLMNLIEMGFVLSISRTSRIKKRA